LVGLYEGFPLGASVGFAVGGFDAAGIFVGASVGSALVADSSRNEKDDICATRDGI